MVVEDKFTPPYFLPSPIVRCLFDLASAYFPSKQMAGTAQKILIREAFIGLGLAIAGGAAWKVAVAAPTTRTYKAYYRKLEKDEAEHPKQPTPEQTEIEEKLYEMFKQLKAEQGGAEGTGEGKESEEEEG